MLDGTLTLEQSNDSGNADTGTGDVALGAMLTFEAQRYVDGVTLSGAGDSLATDDFILGGDVTVSAGAELTIDGGAIVSTVDAETIDGDSPTCTTCTLRLEAGATNDPYVADVLLGSGLTVHQVSDVTMLGINGFGARLSG